MGKEGQPRARSLAQVVQLGSWTPEDPFFHIFEKGRKFCPQQEDCLLWITAI